MRATRKRPPALPPTLRVLRPADRVARARKVISRKRRILEQIAALVILVLAAGIEYYLISVPVADVESSKKLGPAEIRAVDEVVSFHNPRSGDERFSLSYARSAESKRKLFLDAYFDHAALSEETLQRLRAFGINPPAELARISYLTSSAHNGNCETQVKVEASTTNGDGPDLKLSQSEIMPSDRYRSLDARLDGADSTATLSSQGQFLANGASPCVAELSVGDWKQMTQGFVTIKINVPTGSGLRFRWEETEIQPSGWVESGPPVALLSFGERLKSSFTADAIAITKSEAVNLEPRLMAQGTRKDSPLKIVSLLIATDHMELTAIGSGHVLENGKVVGTRNVLEAINKNPILSSIFAAGNLALLGWVGRKLMPKPKSKTSE